MGCGCRGRELAAGLVARGHAVRGTTRDPAAVGAIETAGAQGVVADPNRLATLTPQLAGCAVVSWLMGSAHGEPGLVAALHGPRLDALLERLVDSGVRGLVYERAGSVEPGLLEQGEEIVRDRAARHRIPIEVAVASPDDPSAWTAAHLAAVDGVLSAP